MRSQALELRRAPRARAPGLLLLWATGAATGIILLVLAVLLLDIIAGGAGVISWEFIFANPRRGMTEGGIFPAIFGTVALTLLMTVAAVPAGVATAVFLTEYAPADSKLARAIRVCIANLAGVPSIVFGLFGLGFFVSTVGRGIDRALYGGEIVYGTPSLVWASLTLAILTLPVVVVATEEALRAVPREIRDASMALGATKLQTVIKVVLPEAMGGVLTGTILAISRGAGEVAPIMFTGVAYFLPYLPRHFNDQFMSLSYHVYVLATQSPNVDKTKPVLYGTVLTLLTLTFLLNLLAVVLRARTRAKVRASE
ncbi:MAG TPA: phosphate ABC transporter permease PstA [Polyangiaceae bacterium]|jgi:phosphate transport system permease protein|nr:phosphate ABC transporter permease PstA [Polyangiaceae bacterium]